MTTHTQAPAPIESVYALPSLTASYTAALANKQSRVDDFFKTHPNADWAKNWPDGNTQSESFVVDWLNAQQDQGATQIKTTQPISGEGALSNPQNTLLMQIKSGRAFAL